MLKNNHPAQKTPAGEKEDYNKPRELTVEQGFKEMHQAIQKTIRSLVGVNQMLESMMTAMDDWTKKAESEANGIAKH